MNNLLHYTIDGWTVENLVILCGVFICLGLLLNVVKPGSLRLNNKNFDPGVEEKDNSQ